MDFKYLVESGKYTTEGFTDDQKAYLNGFDYAAEEIETAAANRFETFEDSTMIEKAVAEVQRNAAKEIADWLYHTKCEIIVSFCEENMMKGEES